MIGAMSRTMTLATPSTGSLALVVYPRNDCRALRRRVVIRSVVTGKRATVRLFDDRHVDGVVREQDFADVAEQDVDSLFAVDFLVAVHRDLSGARKVRFAEGALNRTSFQAPVAAPFPSNCLSSAWKRASQRKDARSVSFRIQAALTVPCSVARVRKPIDSSTSPRVAKLQATL